MHHRSHRAIRLLASASNLAPTGDTRVRVHLHEQILPLCTFPPLSLAVGKNGAGADIR